MVHNVFHVSQLKRCLWVPNEPVEIEGLTLQLDLTYVEHPVKILNEKERVTRNSVVKFNDWRAYILSWFSSQANERRDFHLSREIYN